MKLKISKGDTVEVIAGADKRKKGSVLAINKNKLRIKVSGVRVQTHFDAQDGLKKLEGFIDYSNVKLVKKSETGGAKKKTKRKTKSKSKSASR